MRSLLLCCFFIGTTFFGYSQFDVNYTPLECQGKIPERILTSLKAKMKVLEINQVEENISEKEKRIRNKYSVQTNYVLDRLLRSGSVLFNDEVSTYLNSVAQELLNKTETELQNKIVIYTLRSTAVNAFATERGDIFVTLGLLSKLNNKSELAFVLAHEISHVVQHHNLNKYIVFETKNKKDRKKEGAKNGTILSTSELLKKCLYSQSLESEADSLGTIRYLQAGYHSEHLFHVFDVLETAHLPFSSDEFPFGIFESPHFHISDSIKKVHADALPTGLKSKDSLSSHPGTEIRREMVKGIMSSYHPKNPQTPSASDYNRIQQIARFEMPLLYLNEQRLSMAIYTAGCMLNKYPNNYYLKYCIAQSLYLQAIFRNQGEQAPAEWHFDQGSKSIDSLIRGLPAKTFNFLSYHYALTLAEKHPTEELLAIVDDHSFMTIELVQKAIGDSLDYYPLQDVLPLDKIKNGIERKIKALKKDLVSQDNHTKRYRKVLLLNPEYLALDNRKTGEVEYLQTESGQKNVSKQILYTSGKSKIAVENLDAKALSADDVSKFNDIRYLSDYMSLQSAYESNTMVVLPGRLKVKKIMSGYNASYLLHSGFVSIHEKNYSVLLLPASIILWPTLPITIKSMLRPKYNLMYYSLLNDPDKNQIQLINFNYFSVKENNTLLKAHTYSTFYKIEKFMNANDN